MAASSSGIRAGAAFVELTIRDSALVKGLDRAAKRLRAFGASIQQMGLKLAAVGSAVFAPLLASTKVFATVGDNLQEMAQRTGLSVEALSELAFAAELSGASAEDLEAGIRGMHRFVGELAQGSDSARRVLSSLGITAAQLASASPEQRLGIIADALNKVQDPALKAATAMEIFGRSGMKLLPLMSGGAAEMNELRKQARDLGLTISSADADAAAKFNDVMDAMFRVLKQTAFVIGAALAPLVQRLGEAITRVVVRVNEWVKQNRQIIQTIFKVAAGVVIAGGALLGLGVTVSALGIAIGGVAAIVKAFGAAIALAGTVIAAVFSPIGLLIAAVGTLGVVIAHQTGVAGQAIRWLGDRFADLSSTVATSWKAIGQAVAAGDIALAAKVLWLTIKLEFQKGVAFITDLWTSFRFVFQKIFTEAAFGILRVWTDVVTSLTNAWVVFITASKKALETVRNFFTKVFIRLMGLFDEEIDVEAAMKMADSDLEKFKSEADREAQQRVGATEADRQERLDAIEEGRREALGELEAGASEKFKQTAVAIEEARQQWRQAIKEAGAAPSTASDSDSLRSAADSLSGVASSLQFSADKQSTRGTFNAAAIAGLQSGGRTEERIAKAAEETARNTRRIEQALEKNQLAFA
jgi:hypothetical protein